MRPALQIDQTARTALAEMMAVPNSSLVATLVYATLGNEIPPKWSVAFYDRASISVEDIVDVDGIAFCFYQGADAASRLDGATLCYENGEFRIDEQV